MPHPILLVLVIAFAAVVLSSGIWVPLLFWYRQRQADRRFAALAAGLGVPRVGDTIEIEASGHRFQVSLHVPFRNSPRIIEVAIARPAGGRGAGPHILLRVENGLDRFG